MPQAIAIPIITGVASIGAGVGGAALASSANKRAADVQGKANDAAIAFEREKEATRKAEYDRSQAEAKAQWDAKEAIRTNLMRRYGLTPTHQAYPGAGGVTTPARGLTLGALAGNGASTPPPVMPIPGAPPPRPPVTLGSLWNWNGQGG